MNYTYDIQIGNQRLVYQKLSPVPPCINWTSTNQKENRKLHIDRDTSICLHIFFKEGGGEGSARGDNQQEKGYFRKKSQCKREILCISGETNSTNKKLIHTAQKEKKIFGCMQAEWSDKFNNNLQQISREDTIYQHQNLQ